ncbi:hypothetical protein HK100_004678 [Physocladia obscura]|uniref:PSP1 C-terminal domain-containing protein n=1 Tax=Physocladia obscura TaxID=109957 RepID=A0AAD5T641_9FUNG|nr:hypothetical protein HK100_004678 [Physocladia obscura]
MSSFERKNGFSYASILKQPATTATATATATTAGTSPPVGAIGGKPQPSLRIPLVDRSATNGLNANANNVNNFNSSRRSPAESAPHSPSSATTFIAAASQSSMSAVPNPHSPPPSARSQSPATRPPTTTPNMLNPNVNPASVASVPASPGADSDFSSPEINIAPLAAGGPVSTSPYQKNFIPQQLYQQQRQLNDSGFNWRTVGSSPTRKQSISYPQSPAQHDFQPPTTDNGAGVRSVADQLAAMNLGGGRYTPDPVSSTTAAAIPHIQATVFDDDEEDDLVLSRKRNIRARTASTPNAMMGIPPSGSAFLENYNSSAASGSWNNNNQGNIGNWSGSNANSSIWNVPQDASDALSPGMQTKQYRSLSFSLEAQQALQQLQHHQPSQQQQQQSEMQRRSSFAHDEAAPFPQQPPSRARTPLLGINLDHQPQHHYNSNNNTTNGNLNQFFRSNDASDFGFAAGRSRSKSSVASSYPAQYLSSSPGNSSIWANNDGNTSVNAILHRRSSTQPSAIDSRWGDAREPLRIVNDDVDSSLLNIGLQQQQQQQLQNDTDRYRRRHSHAPNLYADLAAQLIASSRPTNDADLYDARRRHSLGGPPLYANYLNEMDANLFKNGISGNSALFNDINDYFENTEYRTKAWVEAGKNLQKQNSYNQQQQQQQQIQQQQQQQQQMQMQLGQVQHLSLQQQQQQAPQQYWPVYVVEFKAGRIDYFHAADVGNGIVRSGDLVIVEADRGKDLGKVVHDGLTNAMQLQAFQAQHKDIMVESLISGKEIVPKRIYGLAQASEVALLVSKAQDEAKAMSGMFSAVFFLKIKFFVSMSSKNSSKKITDGNRGRGISMVWIIFFVL